MRTFIVSTQMFLEEFFADSNGGMDWLIYREVEWVELLKDLRPINILLLGREMYFDYAAHWRAVLNDPTSDKYQKEYAGFADKMLDIVFSKTHFTADWENTTSLTDSDTLMNGYKSFNKTSDKNVTSYSKTFMFGVGDPASNCLY